VKEIEGEGEVTLDACPLDECMVRVKRVTSKRVTSKPRNSAMTVIAQTLLEVWPKEKLLRAACSISPTAQDWTASLQLQRA